MPSQASVSNATMPRSAVPNAYDHAFVLLALSTVYALDRDAQVKAEIDALLAFIDAHLRSPNGGVAEGFPASLPRPQNPQMHLFEAMIAAFNATHGRRRLLTQRSSQGRPRLRRLEALSANRGTASERGRFRRVARRPGVH